jgi:uncharacterized protein (TIGR03792 family)
MLEWRSHSNAMPHKCRNWTQALANYAGFIGKEVWLNPNEPTEIILVIRWVTPEQWK